MDVTANDISCIAGELVEQRAGAWTARVEIDEEDKTITKSISLKLGTESLSGTVVRGDVPDGKGRWVGQVVGGKGGLDKVLDAKSYNQATLRVVVKDALASAGETLSTDSTTASLLSPLKARWCRAKGQTRSALAAVAKEIGAVWRVNRAGQVVFVKDESWRKADFVYDYIDSDPSDGVIEISPDETPGARPGVMVGEHKCTQVTTTWSGAGVRQLIVVETGTGQAKGEGEAFVAAVRKITESPINYSQWYPSKVIQQDPDGSLHLLPDDARVRGSGMQKVPLKTGIPGLSVKVQPGTYVRLFFENGNPGSPSAALWDHASGVIEVQLQASAKVTVNATQSIELASPQIKLGPAPSQSNVNGELLMAYIDGITSLITTALAAITPGPTSSGGGPASIAFSQALQGLTGAKQAALSQVIKVQ